MATAQTAVSVQSGAASEQGVRNTMEDAHVNIDSLADQVPIPPGPIRSFYAVYDGISPPSLVRIFIEHVFATGHGGTEAAKLAGLRVHQLVAAEQAFSAGKFEEALRVGFAVSDREILETS